MTLKESCAAELLRLPGAPPAAERPATERPTAGACSTHALGTMLPTIRISTFGTLHVQRGDYTVTEADWHTRQARQLLKILLTERPRAVSSDRLIEILWPNSPPGAAATTLRSAINALRNVLEPDRLIRAPSRYIVTQAPGYAFRIHPDIWIDAEAFEKELEISQRAETPAERSRHLHAAIQLYQDDYLSSDPYADWVRPERERLQELYFAALLRVAELQADTGGYTAAMAACRQVLTRDPVREIAYQALMRYQAAAGDSAAALLTYERCRNILNEELGADPSPVTQQLHQRILNGEIHATPAPAIHGPPLHGPPPQAVQPSVAPWPQITILPHHATHADAAPLVGRAAELAQLSGALRAALGGHGNLLAVEGEAGIGKSRLAHAVFQEAMTTGATILTTACQALEQQLPFAPWLDLIGRYLQRLPPAHHRDLPLASLAQVAPFVPALPDALGVRQTDLAPPLAEGSIGADENRRRLIEGVLAFLAAVAQQRPLVVLLDDLHWADSDTLTVLGRLAQRIDDLPILVLVAYRSEDLAENHDLSTLRHALRHARETSGSDPVLTLARLNEAGVHDLLQTVNPATSVNPALAGALYHATQGNPLFLTEALRAWQEHADSPPALSNAEDSLPIALRRNRRVQEVIHERMERLPAPAYALLQLAAVIGRAFSSELLELSADHDPLDALQTLLRRKFLVETPDQRLDFSHALVRDVAYDSINLLLRRRYHARVAQALERQGRADHYARDMAFHYRQAGQTRQLPFVQYSVLAGEQLLRTLGLRQAIAHFDDALTTLAALPDAPADLTRRALQGRGLAYESLLDPDGVTDSYQRLHTWASSRGDRELMLMTHSRFTSVLTLLGNQRASNDILAQVAAALGHTDPAAPQGHSRVITDLIERRAQIFSREQPTPDTWTPFAPPRAAVPQPLADLRQWLEPPYAVLPLFDYGWTLLAQGQLGEATHCLEAVIDLAQTTAQPAIVAAAYHQLAITARVLGNLDQCRALTERSLALYRDMPGNSGELAGIPARLTSAFLTLDEGRSDEAERRLHRILDLLQGRSAFHSYRHSANIGLGLIALGRGRVAEAQALLETALADPFSFHPYTHARGLIGLAATQPDARGLRCLRRALHFAGSRSLLEEYLLVLTALLETHPRPEGSPLPADLPRAALIQSALTHARAIHLTAAEATLLRLRAA